MRLFLRLGMERTAWSLRRLHCPVRQDALVLEVGSGGNPYARSNVLLDAYEVTRQRHWAPLKVDRPLVLGFVENLPFRDGAFDFVIASHVLEHSSHPERFLAELQRVARAGYIEVPDAFMERINPYRDHRLEVSVRDRRLVIRKKPAQCLDPELVELYEHRAKPLIAGKLIPQHPFAFHVRHYWENCIEFTIVNPEVRSDWDSAEDSSSAAHASSQPGGWRSIALNMLRAVLSQTGRNRTIDLIALLRCPECAKTQMECRGAALVCKSCDVHYPVSNGVPAMYPR